MILFQLLRPLKKSLRLENVRSIAKLLTVSIFLLSSSGWALPRDVSKIFDRNKRRLDAPPSELRSDEVGGEGRYQTAEDSLDEVMKVEPNASQKEIRINSGRNEQRQEQLDRYAFSGKRIFGVGFVGAGAYGIFGGEVDFGFGNEWSGGLGIGTGMAYATWGVHARRYFQQGNLTPYFQVGYANWIMNRDPYREDEIYPLYLGEQFLQNSDGSWKVRKRIHLIYPAIGVLFQSSSGISFNMHLQYLISALDFKGALAGSFGMHFYF